MLLNQLFSHLTNNYLAHLSWRAECLPAAARCHSPRSRSSCPDRSPPEIRWSEKWKPPAHPGAPELSCRGRTVNRINYQRDIWLRITFMKLMIYLFIFSFNYNTKVLVEYLTDLAAGPDADPKQKSRKLLQSNVSVRCVKRPNVCRLIFTFSLDNK